MNYSGNRASNSITIQMNSTVKDFWKYMYGHRMHGIIKLSSHCLTGI